MSLGINLGIDWRKAQSGSPPPVSPLGPSTASYYVTQSPGTIIAEITGMKSTEYISSFSPNDGRVALAGGGRRLVVGLSASSVGSFNVVLTSTLGNTLTITLTVVGVALTVQSIGNKTLANVPVNPITPLNAGATISGGNAAGHFAISAGKITVTSTGDAADLNLGPYTLTISGDSNYGAVIIPIETSMNWYSVTTGAEMVAAYNDASLVLANRVELLDGCTVNPRSPTDTSQAINSTSLAVRAFSGSVDFGVDGFTGGLEQIKARIRANGLTAQGSYTGGGYVELTCRSRGSASIDGKLAFANGQRGILITKLAWVATAPVTMYVPPNLTTKWLPTQLNNFTGGLTPGTNEIGASITSTAIVSAVTRVTAGSGGTNGTYNLTFTGGGGSGAAGTFTVAAGAISSVVLTSGGSGYSTIPTVTLDPAANLTGASVTASIGYNGGTGYVTGEAWTWSDGVDTISGTITATAGVITGATITSKTAGIDAKMKGPVCLTTAATGNGIRSASGVNGTLAITHNNYSFGPPPGAATYALLNNTSSAFAQIDGSGTATVYPTQCNDMIIRGCIFGGYRNNPDDVSQWINIFNGSARWSRNFIFEDNYVHGIRNGIHVGFAREAHIRRNDIQLNIEDAMRVFEPSAWASPSQMNASTADDFANGGTQCTVHIYLNNIHNNIDLLSFQSLHSDGAQFGTFVNTFGARGYLWNNRCVMPNGSTQGLPYNDDAFTAAGGYTFIVENNLILTGFDQANAIVAFRGNTTRLSRFANNTLIQLLESQNANNGASIVRRGNGSGYVLDSNIYGSFWNDSGYAFGGTSITAAGTGYVTGDKIIITNPYGVVGYGTLTATAGAITGVTWTVEPTGFSSSAGLSTAGTKALSTYTNDLNADSNTWCRLYSDTGSGGTVKALSGSLDPQVYIYDNGAKTFGYGQNAGTAMLTNNTSVRPVTANTGAGNSLQELFDGTFTRVTGTYTGWNYTDVDHTPTVFRTAIDAIFTPKTGSVAIGKGHLIDAPTRTADSTQITADSTKYTADQI